MSRKPEPYIPCHIPDHTLVRVIGRGAYGEVWLAKNVMGTWRAVKIVRRESFTSERPYEREFEGIRKFEPVSRAHDTQVDILHVGRDDAAGLFYYVMELGDDVLSGQEINPETYAPRTLESELKEKQRLPARQCVDIGLALATALNHLHEHGLIHRDIKPSNIIFVHGRPKLADIGLVAEAADAVSFVGTEGYVPMEGPGSSRADIFSLGRVLYEISTGLSQRQFPDIPSSFGLDEEDAEMARELNLVINKACARGADHRHESAAALRDELVLLQSGHSIRRLRENERRLRVVRWVGALAMVVAAFSLVGYFSARRANIRADANANAALQNLAAARLAQAAAEARVDFMTRELPPLLAPLGRLDLLDSVFKNAGDYYSRHPDSTPEQLARRADFMTEWAQILAPRGDAKGVLSRLEEALALASKAAPDQGSADLRAARARVFAGWRMGEALIKNNELDRAASTLNETLAFAAAQQTDDLEFRALVARLALEPAFLEGKKGAHDKALAAATESLRQWTALRPRLLADGSAKSQEALITAAQTHVMLAQTRRSLGDQKANDASLLQAMEAAAQLVNWKPENLRFTYHQALTLITAGEFMADPPRPKRTLFDEADRLLVGLLGQDPSNVHWRITASESALKRYEEGKKSADEDELKRIGLEAVERSVPLHRLYISDLEHLRMLNRFGMFCGAFYYKHKDWPKVQEHWRFALCSIRRAARLSGTQDLGDMLRERTTKATELLTEAIGAEAAQAWLTEFEKESQP